MDLDTEIAALSAHPAHSPKTPTPAVNRLAVIGAGAMGRGIAQVAAVAGLQVQISDVTLDSARAGLEQIARALDDAVAKGRLSPEDGTAALARIRAVAGDAHYAEVDLVIEAVFETVDLKHAVLRQVAATARPGTLIGSNTSSLPIHGLAVAVGEPAEFLGIHFFSPVDRMPLVELIPSTATSSRTVERAAAFVRSIGKVPITVGDQRGFFTSRVFNDFTEEGIRLLVDGAGAERIERIATQVGFPAPPLAMCDATTQILAYTVMQETRSETERDGREYVISPPMAVITRFVEEFGRPGRPAGAGFYDYPAGQSKRLWDRLDDLYPALPGTVSDADVADRLLFSMAVDSIRCLEQGVLRSVAEGNVGSVLGIGFPRALGGVFRFVDTYPGGPAGFLARTRQLEAAYGSRFAPPLTLVELAESGGSFSAPQP